MRLSYADKLRLAEQIRNTTPIRAQIDPAYQAFLDQVVINRRSIETREGLTPVFIVRTAGQESGGPLIVNFHGGGFCIGHHERDLVFSAKMAVRTGGVVVDVDYRLAPEYGYPVAIHEGYDVVRWCFQHADELGGHDQRVIVIGHSAGASIVGAVCLKSNETKDFKVDLQILDYPATDLTQAKETGLSQEKGRGAAFRTLYTDDIEEIVRSPYVSLVFAAKEQLTGMPDALLITAEHDPLRFEAHRYGENLKAAGVTVTERCFPDSAHGFVIYGNGRRDEAHEFMIRMIKQIVQRNG